MLMQEEALNRLRYRARTHPKYPLSFLEFLKTELQLGKKYTVVSMGSQEGRLLRLLYKHVHTLWVIESQEEKLKFIKDSFHDEINCQTSTGSPENTPFKSDTVDCVILAEDLDRLNSQKTRKELKRILRLNSYAILLFHQIQTDRSPFAKVYVEFAQKYTSKQEEEYQQVLPKEKIERLFKNDYEQRSYPNQQRFDREELENII